MSRKIPSNHASRRNDDKHPNDHLSHPTAADHPERARPPARATYRAARARAAPDATAPAAAPPTTSTTSSPETPDERSPAAPSLTPSSPLPSAQLLLTPAEAATLLHINRSTLYPLLMRGDIPSIRIGRARRIPVSALMRWIDQQVSAQRTEAGTGGAP